MNFDLRSEVTYFDRDDDNILVSDVNGGRLDLFPSVSYPLYSASTFLEPKAGFRYTQYDLNNINGTQFKSSPSRVLPVLSLDSGVFLERDTSLFNTSYLQTLEPRLFYLYIPEDNQDDLPVFDTGQYDFSFASLFREDRFSGPDRMGDANQVTLAMTSRLIDHASGTEAGYVSLGQIYYLHDRQVFLPGGKERDEASSPLIAEAGTSAIKDWRLRGSIQWDPNNNKTEKLVAFAQYSPDINKIINLGYRVRRSISNVSGVIPGNSTDIEQTELSFLWPLTHQWNIVGRWN